MPKFDKTPIDGFSFWQGENPTIVLTLRLNRIDNYAFALLHEIYHVYMHLFNNREQKYISIEGAEINKCEEEANVDCFTYGRLSSRQAIAISLIDFFVIIAFLGVSYN